MIRVFSPKDTQASAEGIDMRQINRIVDVCAVVAIGTLFLSCTVILALATVLVAVKAWKELFN